MIETERLLMRPFGADDAELLNQLYSNEEIMRYMPFDLEDLEASRARLERILRDWQADPVMNYEFAVIRKDTGEKIGRSHIQIDADTDTGMVGWLLLEKNGTRAMPRR
ncbi:MAG: GNAT family N-acetyltransferase [Solobacterium sp.]|nr:GNAT family N-acetyltransferase [Solobacterium sp.]